jgi:single-strand DNA-binding protein
MASYNKVILMGNITRDIELRHLPSSNNAIAKFGIAVNRKWRDNNTNELREEVTFVDCDAFGKTAENIAKFFSKGKPIFVEGRLKLDTWKDKTDGSDRSKMKVVVESFEFIESRGAGGGGAGADGVRANAGAPARAAAPAGARSNGVPAGKQLRDDGPGYESANIQEDDIPF